MTIRRQPEDFIVEEMLTSAATAIVRQDQGPFALYELHKKSTNTPDAISDLARELRINPSDLAFVGLKDKHAVTSQYVSARLLKAPVTVGKGNWEARRIGWLNHQLDADMVAGNRFKLVVRNLAPAKAGQMDGYARQLMPADKRTLFIVNYFGDQRFGSARHQQGFAAPLLLRGDYLGALKLLIATPSRTDKQSLREFRRTLAQGWGDFAKVLPRLPRCADRRAVEVLAKNPEKGMEAFAALPYFTQQMCVYSYQSYLWNRMARLLLEERCPKQGYEVEDAFGAMLFMPLKDVPDPLLTLDLPLPGRGTQMAEPWRKAAEKVLREEGLNSLRQLRLPGLRRPFFGESPRQLFMQAGEFRLGPVENDSMTTGRKMRWVGFTLPRGGYATVVLRALGQ